MAFITTKELEERVKFLEKYITPQFILIEAAALKYGVSREYISRKVSKYNVPKLKEGRVKNNPVLESELIRVMKIKEPTPDHLKKLKIKMN